MAMWFSVSMGDDRDVLSLPLGPDKWYIFCVKCENLFRITNIDLELKKYKIKYQHHNLQHIFHGQTIISSIACLTHILP